MSAMIMVSKATMELLQYLPKDLRSQIYLFWFDIQDHMYQEALDDYYFTFNQTMAMHDDYEESYYNCYYSGYL
jgi:hypothetical protein